MDQRPAERLKTEPPSLRRAAVGFLLSFSLLVILALAIGAGGGRSEAQAQLRGGLELN